MGLSVASFNIEKDGQSSTYIKQEMVNGFIDNCVRIGTNIIFLCEVHSARVQDFVAFLSRVYTTYNVVSFDGGYSNNYVLMYMKSISFEISFDTLFGLNRKLVVVYTKDAQGVLQAGVLLAHFKSGQTGLTQSQLVNAAIGMAGLFPNGQWAIMGDMNWDMNNAAVISTSLAPHQILVYAYTCWGGLPTQQKGGVLDWCLASAFATANAIDLTSQQLVYDMSGPDHRPILFNLFA